MSTGLAKRSSQPKNFQIFRSPCNKSPDVGDCRGVRQQVGGQLREKNMKKLMITSLVRASQIRDAAADDRGGVAAEYGVLLAGIVGVVAIAAAALGGRIGGLFDSILP